MKKTLIVLTLLFCFSYANTLDSKVQSQQPTNNQPTSTTPKKPLEELSLKFTPTDPYGLEHFSKEQLDNYVSECFQGKNENACFDLGIAYYQGRSVERQDLKLAGELLQVACAGSRALGCYQVGIMSLNGMGISKNYSLAFLSLKRACGSGDLRGCRNLGVMYYKGLGIGKNTYLASEVFNSACKRGDKLSCQYLELSLGDVYFLAGNLVGAKNHYDKACQLRNTEACRKGREVQLIRENLLFQDIIDRQIPTQKNIIDVYLKR